MLVQILEDIVMISWRFLLSKGKPKRRHSLAVIARRTVVTVESVDEVVYQLDGCRNVTADHPNDIPGTL
jgi:hypothetical protein